VPKVIIEPLKGYPLEIASVTSMTDDGGSTGELRKELKVMAPGDLRRHILAFSDAPQWKKDLWNMRFGSQEFPGGHKGHNFGNLFLAGLCTQLKDCKDMLAECCAFMQVEKRFRPLPATLGDVALCAELENGQIIEGESEIDVPKMHDPSLKIKKVFLKDPAKAYEPVLEEIAQADALIFGPGDMYSSLIPCFLARGIKKAIKESSAKKILVCNVMNKHGETDDFTVEDFTRETEKYIGTRLDFVLYNKFFPNEATISSAKESDDSVASPVAFGYPLDEKKFIAADLAVKGGVNHDPKKTAEMLWKLIN